jgi:hypothetical protein
MLLLSPFLPRQKHITYHQRERAQYPELCFVEHPGHPFILSSYASWFRQFHFQDIMRLLDTFAAASLILFELP